MEDVVTNANVYTFVSRRAQVRGALRQSRVTKSERKNKMWTAFNFRSSHPAIRSVLLGAVSTTALAVTVMPSALAQEAADSETIEELVVFGEIVYKSRTEKVTPVIDYDARYFQRFEPVSVGDAIKRLPGVVFSDEVNEYESVQLRGLGPEFTQVLINGRRVPGGGNNRAFLIDRVPAELIRNVQIVRSPSADMPSEGVAGSVNIELRDPDMLDGGYFRGGLLHYDDGEIRGAGSMAYGTSVGDVNLWGAVDIQERHFTKERVILFQDPDDLSFLGQREEESDTRDSQDVSANFVADFPFMEGDMRVRGLIVSTDQDEEESGSVFEEDDAGDLQLVEIKGQVETNSQLSYLIDGDIQLPTARGDVGIYVAYAYFDDDLFAVASEAAAGDPLEPVESELIETQEESITGEIFYSAEAGKVTYKAGLQLLSQDRDTLFRLGEFEDGVDTVVEESIFTVAETRIDPYLKGNWAVSEQVDMEVGVRVERTSRDVKGAGFDTSTSFTEVNPSIHATYHPTSNAQFRASLARTVRNPNYDQMVPVPQQDVPADDDIFTGNPNLTPETAWGLDIGYEREIGSQGLLGVNFFLREIDDLIDVVATGPAVDGIQPFTADNIGDGTTYGVEIDLDVPLDYIGLEDTGFFANYSRLESSVKDPITGENRQFRNQPKWVYNVGIIKNFPDSGIAAGFTYNRRASSEFGDFGEIVTLEYDGILDLFVEKRLGNRAVIRLSATNVLDAEQSELLRVFAGDTGAEIRESIRNGTISDIESQVDTFGPIIQLTGRITF